MHDWNFTPDHPIKLTLSADARLGPTDYVNDHIWELNFGDSEPPAISLQTTFGLRARICRIFPRFIYNGKTVNNPAHFHHPITIHHYYPNYISLSFKPFSSINVDLQYWVPGSQVIGAIIKITNTSHDLCQIQIEWAELLIPSGDGHRMADYKVGMTTILAGQTANLAPVLFLTGGAQTGKSSYPALNIPIELPPYGQQEMLWVHASLMDMNASYELAKEFLNRHWDAEFARISRVNSQQLEITTGNHDWNTAFSLAQIRADQLFLQSTLDCKQPSFVYSRYPDNGYSMRSDGSDYNHMWNGQTVSDTYYLSNFLLPAFPVLLQGLLDNFLATQTLQGEIDWKPGLAGQRSQLLATPLLATIAWRLYEYTGNLEYIKAAFPKLVAFFFSWFSTAHDRDNDLIPEWDRTVQTGYEDHPQFSIGFSGSVGLNISMVESPDLCSYLYHECQSLLLIARKLAEIEIISRLESIADTLKLSLDQSWSDQQACYLYRDRDSHTSAPAEFLGKITGPGILDINQEFLQPIRPIIHIRSKREGTRPIQIFIHGTSIKGAHRVEHISSNHIHWHLGYGFVTSEYIYKVIEKIEITGMLDEDEATAQSANLTFMDRASLLPLWAGIPTKDKAKILINLSVMNKKKFLSPYGLRSFIGLQELNEVPDESFGMNFPWISMILEGLIQYGERKKSAEVFSRLMKAVVHSFKKDLAFHQSYHSESGAALGVINILTSLIPVGLFLKILGVKIISPTQVEITGNNPFLWPVTIKYRGLTVVQQEKKALIIFSDGQNITIDNNKPQKINLNNQLRVPIVEPIN